MIPVQLTDLKTIENTKGRLYHALKKSETSFKSFGEAYFSSVNQKEIKGWKKHTRMTLNLVVVCGIVRFVIFDESQKTFQEYILSRNSKEQYKRLTVPPGYWMAFQGLSDQENLLLNLADIEHEPTESINQEIHEIKYEW